MSSEGHLPAHYLPLPSKALRSETILFYLNFTSELTQVARGFHQQSYYYHSHLGSEAAFCGVSTSGWVLAQAFGD